MKVATAINGNIISQHFGHCESFKIYEVEENKIVNENVVANPGHRPGFLPVFLRDNGVNVIIAGGMGVAAQRIFEENGIEVIVGADGDTDEAVKRYLSNELKSTGSFCDHEHDH
jgi:predicted Fe-Mo cluster-binding NifX family protein